MREADNRRLWELHALAPRLGLFADREQELPIDYDEILTLLAQRPCLLVTPTRDRLSNYAAVARTVRAVQSKVDTITWESPDDVNRFQADQHELLLRWLAQFKQE